jgi:hypothetical protein
METGIQINTLFDFISPPSEYVRASYLFDTSIICEPRQTVKQEAGDIAQSR